MANRKLPFGYETQRGIVCINVTEASIVREIYTAYIGGMSYSQITDHLNTQAVPYNEKGKPWNKNMVARILGCELYTGSKSYPAILSNEEYRQVEMVKPSSGKPLDTSGGRKVVRQLARCASCGNPLSLSANNHGWERWYCSSCNIISANAVMTDTLNAVSHILAIIRNSPELVQISFQPEYAPQISIEQVRKEFETVLHADEFDELAAKSAVLSLASARFNALGSEDYETRRIQYILARAEQCDGLDITLLRQITSAILIHPDGEVSLKLKNGQIVKGSV